MTYIHAANINTADTDTTLTTTISAAVQTLGLNLTIFQIQALEKYLLLLNKWNAAYNLSALKTLPDMLVKHLFDCLAVVQPIVQRLSRYPSDAQTILDVGTGAGLPGLILAICLPNVQVTMLDAVQKKIIFVRQAIGALQLSNAQAHGVRIQDWQGNYSLVTARAWTALADIPLLTAHCIAKNGCIAAMKGPRLATEAEALPEAWRIESVLDIVVPNLNEARSLAFLQRTPAINNVP
jgi:16S rRNA (guanine527-N7)-methyltransferase